MAYETSKDQTLKEYKSIDIGAENKLVAKIVKYGEGDPKFSIQKTFITKDGDERATSKIGRIDYETLIALKKIIDSAVEDLHEF